MTKDILAPPPLIVLAGYLVGRGLHSVFTYTFLPLGWEWVAWPLLTAGFALIVWAGATLRKHKTPINPYESATTIVTTGPYRFSRNPVYVGLVLIYLSMAVYQNALMIIILLPAVVALLHYGVIVREEERLKQSFGNTYAAYARRVRRWL